MKAGHANQLRKFNAIMEAIEIIIQMLEKAWKKSHLKCEPWHMMVGGVMG